jgi:hypothetical protein
MSGWLLLSEIIPPSKSSTRGKQITFIFFDFLNFTNFRTKIYCVDLINIKYFFIKFNSREDNKIINHKSKH